MSPCYVAIDLETTGLDPERDVILEVAAVRFDGERVLDVYHRLVRPEAEIPLAVERLTGLSKADFDGAEPLFAVLNVLRDFVGNDPIVGQSVEFDLRFLANHGLRFDQPALDTFELATILVPEARRYGLGHLIEHFGLDVSASHRALDDAHAHRLLFDALLERARRLPPTALATINRLGAGLDWPLFPVFQHAAATPLAIGARQEEAPASSFPPLKKASRPRDVPIDDIEALIGAGGRLAQRIDRYEDRPGQRAMLRRVGEAFNLGDHVMIEAGTGTGKSLAYLLPAATWAMANGRAVVVATNTITLQDQLLESDLPLARSLIGDDLRFCVLKGRANYLCRSRFERFIKREDLDLDAVRTVAKILAWMPITQTGDRAELMLRPEDGPTWRQVSAEGDACTRDRCVHAARGRCFVHLARSRAAAAHVVVVNHALLATHVAAGMGAPLGGGSALPEHRHLIVDEAHHLEGAATEALGDLIGARMIGDAAGAIGGGGSGGLPARLRTVAALESDLEVRDALLELIDPLTFASATVRREADRLFEVVARAAGGEATTRLTHGSRRNEAWLDVEMAWDRAREALVGLNDRAVSVQQRLLPYAAANGPGYSSVASVTPELEAAARTVSELNGAIFEIRQMVERLDRIVAAPHTDDVTWISRRFDGVIQLRRAPLHVGGALSTHLFADKEALVLTSATLRAPDFDFVRNRLSIHDADALVVDSPFDYSEQVLLCAPSDVPAPGRTGYDASVARALIPLCTAIGGRTLALFTSHSGLRQVYHAIRGPLGEHGISVIAQGVDGSRHSLLSTLREPTGPTVVLGTRSFWEGVDVPGDALSCLVIARLPFDVPNDPIVAARSETFEDPFEEFSIPQAILRFRQGFGRLVRSRSDRGVAVVLDSRIRSRRYGERFFESLPECRRFDGPVADLPLAARQFLDRSTGPARDETLESSTYPGGIQT